MRYAESKTFATEERLIEFLEDYRDYIIDYDYGFYGSCIVSGYWELCFNADEDFEEEW